MQWQVLSVYSIRHQRIKPYLFLTLWGFWAGKEVGRLPMVRLFYPAATRTGSAAG
jgi:hypothetical protein